MKFFEYTIARAAQMAGVTPATLRRWEARKLAGDPKFAKFPETQRAPHSGHRMYEASDIAAIVSWRLTGDVDADLSRLGNPEVSVLNEK